MSLRKELEQELYDFTDDADPSGKNTERYKAQFTKMSDQEFYKFFDKFFNEPKMNIQIAYEPFNNPVTAQFIEKLAKKHNVPLYEKICKPYVNEDIEDPTVTVHDVLVVDVPIKRLKQMSTLKNHTSMTNLKRDARTGQVTGHDKTARTTDVEAFSLIAQELYSCAQEQYGPMADDEAAMYEMLKQIRQDGEVDLDKLPNDPLNKVTMNTINYYALGSCLVSNLIEDSGYLLPVTLQAKEDKSSTIKRS